MRARAGKKRNGKGERGARQLSLHLGGDTERRVAGSSVGLGLEI